MKMPERKYEEKETEMDLAKLDGKVDIGFESHGCFFMWVTFNYGGVKQGLGCVINEEFIREFLRVFSVEKLGDCKGNVFVEHNDHQIYRLIPLKINTNEKEFDIKRFYDDRKRKEIK